MPNLTLEQAGFVRPGTAEPTRTLPGPPKTPTTRPETQAPMTQPQPQAPRTQPKVPSVTEPKPQALLPQAKVPSVTQPKTQAPARQLKVPVPMSRPTNTGVAGTAPKQQSVLGLVQAAVPKQQSVMGLAQPVAPKQQPVLGLVKPVAPAKTQSVLGLGKPGTHQPVSKGSTILVAPPLATNRSPGSAVTKSSTGSLVAKAAKPFANASALTSAGPAAIGPSTTRPAAVTGAKAPVLSKSPAPPFNHATAPRTAAAPRPPAAPGNAAAPRPPAAPRNAAAPRPAAAPANATVSPPCFTLEQAGFFTGRETRRAPNRYSRHGGGNDRQSVCSGDDELDKDLDNNLDHDLDDDSDDFGDDDFGDLDYDDADDAEYDDEYDDEYEAEWAAVHAMDNGHAHQHRPQDLPQDQLQTKSRLESLRLQAKPSSNFKGTAYPPGSYMVPPPVQSTPATYALCVGPTFDVPVASATPALTDPLWMQPERSASAPKSTPVIYPLFSEGRALSTALPGAHALTEGTGKYVRLPRAYGLACFPGTSDAWHAALLSRLETRETLRFFRGLLFPYQSAAVDHVLRALRESAVHGGLLEAACGAGKTTMALYIASVLGVPVMVLVHTGKLLEQWLLRVAQYLPNARVGTLQGKTRPSTDCDVCIGMLQTVMNLETTVKGYGLLVVDECHHISASSFSKAVAKFSAPYRLGLTATAQRGDGTVHAIEWLIGPRLYRIACTSVRVGVLAVAYDNPAFEHAVRKWDKTKMDWVSTLTRIVSDAWRTRRIAELLYELVVIEGRRVVAISSRVSLLEDLHALLPGSGLIAGKNKSGKDEPLLLASQSLVAEGVDDQRLDTLVLLTPVKVAKDDERLITQAVGRVQERGGVTKARPSLVVDFYDKYQMFHGMFRARRKWYADNGFTFRRPRTVGPPLVRQAVLGTIPARDATNVGLGPRALVGEQADVPADNGIQADSTVSVPVADQAVRIAEPTALCGAPDTRDEPAYTVSPLPPTVPDVKTLYDLRDNVLRAPFPPLPGYVPKMEPVSKPRGKKAQGIVQGNACTAQGAVPVVPGTGSTAPVPGSTASGRRPRAKKAQDPDLAKRPRAKKCAKPAQSVEQTEQSAKPSSRKRKATAPSTGTTTTSAS